MRHRARAISGIPWGAGALLLAQALVAGPLGAQMDEIGTIDLYGLKNVPEDSVRAALAFEIGDPQPGPGQKSAQLRRLKEIPGVLEADMSAVCCRDGKLSVYVGIAEDSSALLAVNPRPTGSLRLTEEMVAADADFQEALLGAARAQEFGDDMSQGHSLMAYPPAWAASCGSRRMPTIEPSRPRPSDMRRTRERWSRISSTRVATRTKT